MKIPIRLNVILSHSYETKSIYLVFTLVGVYDELPKEGNYGE